MIPTPSSDSTKQIRQFDASDLRTTLATLLQLDLQEVSADGDEGPTADVEAAGGTLEVLYDHGFIDKGTELVFREGYLSTSPEPEYSPTDPFWCCRLTGNDERATSVQWCYDASLESMSLTGFAKHILEEAIGEHRENLNGVYAWGHPEFDNTAIYRLAKRIEDGDFTES